MDPANSYGRDHLLITECCFESRLQAHGALGLAFEYRDIATMQAPVLTRAANASMTLPLACLSSAASAHPSISTGKERDTESGNDYFGARYYASSMGRWLSPDWSAKIMPVPYAKLDDPQSLNLYAYLMNNPLGGVDADGHVNPCDVGACPIGLEFFSWLQSSKGREATFAMVHPIAAMQIGSFQHGATNISTNATRIGAGLGLQENAAHEGSEVNAMRHTVWQATMTSRFGADVATQAGNAHEDNPNVDLSVRTFTGRGALDAADQTTDLLNNQIGRAIGNANPGASLLDIAGKALDYFHTNGLYTASTGADGTVTVSQTKISDAEYSAARDRLQHMDQNGFPNK